MPGVDLQQPISAADLILAVVLILAILVVPPIVLRRVLRTQALLNRWTAEAETKAREDADMALRVAEQGPVTTELRRESIREIVRDTIRTETAWDYTKAQHKPVDLESK